MISWPQSLLTEIAERRCVLVLGAGASAASRSESGINPPSWHTFLESGITRLARESDREGARDLLGNGAYLDAAQVIADGLGPGDFSSFVRDTFELPGFQPSEIHELVLQIDPKIIVTTNYDMILESLARRGSASSAYNVSRYYDSHLMNDLRSNRRLIIKAHGCISDPQKIVMTRRQYFAARREYPSFFSALDAIFLTNTLLFVGTGFNGDPDIELMLQNANISAPSDHPHYAVVEEGRHPSIWAAMSETYNIRFLEYPKGRHDDVIEALRRLSDDTDSARAIPS